MSFSRCCQNVSHILCMQVSGTDYRKATCTCNLTIDIWREKILQTTLYLILKGKKINFVMWLHTKYHKQLNIMKTQRILFKQSHDGSQIVTSNKICTFLLSLIRMLSGYIDNFYCSEFEFMERTYRRRLSMWTSTDQQVPTTVTQNRLSATRRKPPKERSKIPGSYDFQTKYIISL